MESRKVSSLSVKSDGSDSSIPRGSNLILEQIGQISASEVTAPKSVTSSGNYICLLAGENNVFIAELKLRADSDCVVVRRAVLPLPGVKEDKHYHDAAIFQVSTNEFRLALLGERKNKERFISVVEVVTSGRVLSLGEELSCYDKASMLGKGVSHIVPFPIGANGETDLLAFSNIVRKLKIEENGAVLKPTSGRVPIPAECVDGTISVCVSENKKGYSLTCSFKTKSAGKNKYQINWFQGRKDEISVPAGKASIKLSEDQEPSVILSDPRDSRSSYIITNNQSDNTSSFSKLIRGRKLEEPITTFPFVIEEAVFLAGPDRTLFLLILNQQTLEFMVFHLTKTEGYRGLYASWSTALEYQDSTGFFNAISCSQSKWQLQSKVADFIVSSRCSYQFGLATLISKGEIVSEPESGAQYRLRLMGGDKMNDVLLILLDDVERTFESEEESLAGMTLKVCLNCSPGREGLSQISGWLMSGRISSVELYCTRLDTDSPVGSDRLLIHTISPDTLRSYVVEQDWTQSSRKVGTFVLDSTVDSTTGASPASIRTSRPSSTRSQGSRIPSASNCRRSMNLDSSSYTNGSSLQRSELSAVIFQVEDSVAPIARANAQIRESIELLEKNLLHLKTISSIGTDFSEDYADE